MEVHALKERGWTITAIATHLGRDRKTIRAYLNGERAPGIRMRSAPDPLEPFAPYLTQRLADDPHVWASALYDEVVALGYALSYPSFARQVRQAQLRPHCEACAGVKGRDTVEIVHPPGEEIQWDWFERRRSPWGGTLYVLLGTLAHSSRVRGVICESMDQAHLIDAMDRVMRKLGGTTRVWRVDRLATVIVPGSRDVQASFAPVAKHYGAVVEPCPPRRGNRKGVVESSVRFVSGRWWRTMTDVDPESAQRSLDRFCETVADARARRVSELRTTVGELADAEVLAALPAPYPATMVVERIVSANATLHFRGNRYSVPPGLTGSTLQVHQRLGGDSLEIRSIVGAPLATHRLAHDGAGVVVRDSAHSVALERVVLVQFTSKRPCDKKAHVGISDAALTEAARLLGDAGRAVNVDLEDYARLVAS
ncbi:MAG: transcriptional regulator [Acidimicrobiaceae bacterium]|nr:transcriptional regulator [Acidimicrobiaceae bacterium]